jgi:phage terminase large subunit-like protein
MISNASNPPRNIAGYDPTVFDGDYWFDDSAADLAQQFIEKHCCHIKGRLAGKLLTLEDWQVDLVRTLFGWKRQDGLRRYRKAFIYLPRKNGKTLLLAAIANLVMFVERFRDAGAEIYIAAASRDQASLLFDIAAGMVRRNPLMQKRCKLLGSVKRIVVGDSFMRALPMEANTAHGFNSSLICCDELHAWEGEHGREFYDVLQTSTGAREEPLSIDITTAGYDKHSICYEQLQHALKVRDNPAYDEAFLPVLYFAADDEDWREPATWRKANPNIDVSISEEFLRAECEKAKNSPAYENTFKRLYLNVFTTASSRWISSEKWAECSVVEAKPEAHTEWAAQFDAKECWAGLDLSTTTDLTAFVLAFPMDGGKIGLLPHFWVPEEGMRRRSRKDRVPYEVWHKQGWLKATPGETVDYEYVIAEIQELSKRYNIREINFDRWGAPNVRIQLENSGLTMLEFGQGFASMSPPSKELEKLVLDGRLDHGNHPVLNWCAANVVAELDAAGNIKPSKKKSTERIDGIVAAVMALGGLVANNTGDSIYSEPASEWGWN